MLLLCASVEIQCSGLYGQHKFSCTSVEMELLKTCMFESVKLLYLSLVCMQQRGGGTRNFLSIFSFVILEVIWCGGVKMTNR